MWVPQSIGGLKDGAARQKFSVLEASKVDAVPQSSSSIVLIGNSRPWFSARIAEARARHLRPIIIGGVPSQYGEDVSGVIYDVRTAIRNIIMYFHEYGRDRIALLNVNNGNSIDKIKAETFIEEGKRLGLGFTEADIYESKPDSVNPIEAFWANVSGYDGTICSNDACGALVIKAAGEYGIRIPEDLFVCGMGDFHICLYSNPTLTSVTRCYYEAGEIAFRIWKSFFSAGWGISSIVMTTTSRIMVRGSTAFLPVPDQRSQAEGMRPEEEVDIQKDYDLSVRRIRDIQSCLAGCDDIDLRIILGILRGESNEMIAERVSISQGTVVYRLRRMYRDARVETKDELAHLLRYMNIETLDSI